ncbi:hypothetical protein F2Q69_00010949 [Brassica cretica]|uniref:Uncharacterized protein n=1 Tax=Brassica cretica TaxID=69181 RepID=A0A8S9QJZ2_BRACR|nr:hypothetical protein F2Q69_00010949 [Brassica cretica]
MNRAENSASIPIDLILEILSRLPSKSSARPRLLFVVHSVGEEEEEELHFYSSSQPRIPYDKSSLVVAADYHTTFPSERCNYASGLICFRVFNYVMIVHIKIVNLGTILIATSIEYRIKRIFHSVLVYWYSALEG